MMKKSFVPRIILICTILLSAINASSQSTAREYYNLAVEKTDQQAYLEAEKLYNKAIALNPLFHEAWFSLGYNLQKLNRNEEAVEKYSQAIKLNPKDLYYLQRADAYMELGKYALGVWDCNEAITLNPDYIEAYYKRAMLYESLQKTEAAIADFSRVLKMGWSDDKLYFEIGWMYEGLNMADSAIRYYEISMIKVPSEKYTHIRIAETVERTGDYDRALQYYNVAIQTFPDYGYAYYMRGYLLYSRFNNRNEGCKDLLKALELGYLEAQNAVNNMCR